MKFTATLFGACAAVLAGVATAQRGNPTPVPVASTDGSSEASEIVGTVRPRQPTEEPETEPPAPASAPSAASPLEKLKVTKRKGEWHMKPVRVVHARVQSDEPELIEGRFVSSFGDGDLAAGYLSAMDNVNTASVEGALMYVQAEGININARSKKDRCTRKNNMRNIVFYDIVIAQTNETIAEYARTWKDERDTFEYGPMVPMDGGKCTAEASSLKKDKLPRSCLQFNGEDGQPNLGPFVGGYIKDDDVRAPYPDTYWFSFPNTCPKQAWGKKSDECRASTRKGLCDIGQAPDGVTCTFAYDILGWVPIDDVVGITKIKNKETGEPYANFTEWCEAGKGNIEFIGDTATGEMEDGLKFWENPLDEKANAARAAKVVSLYNQIVAGKFESSQISPDAVASFKPLPEVEALREMNPVCYLNVEVCNTGYGCRREGYSQLCIPCKKEGEEGCVVEGSFVYPELKKAPSLKDELLEVDSDSGSASADDESLADSGSVDTDIESPATPSPTSTKAKDDDPISEDSAAGHTSVAAAVSLVACLASLVAL